MKFAFALLAAAGLAAAAPAPDAVTSLIAPSGTAPAGCVPTYDGQFEITIVKPSGMTKRDNKVSTCDQTGILTLTLANGQLHDNDGRTGYIAGNNSQFQFDKPVQAGGEYTSGFSVCKNGSIALGPTTQFWQCQSGGFYNLYYSNIAPQCKPVNIDIIPCDGSSGSSGSQAGGAQPVSAYTDGQPQATAAATQAPVPVSVYTDGQPQATAAATQAAPVPVSEYTDGQPQATGNATVAAAPQPTIHPAAAANLGVSGGLIAGVAAVAAALL